MDLEALEAGYQQHKRRAQLEAEQLRAQAAQMPQGQRGKGGSLTSFISEGGALGGGLAGAAIGSAVPIVGTAIGGIIGAGIGAFGGRLAENKVRDNRYGLSDAAKEGAISAVLAGPLKLAKYGKGASAALKAGATFEQAAIAGAGKAAAPGMLTKALVRGTSANAESLSARALGLTKGQKNKFIKETGEKAGSIASRFNVNDIDSIKAAITPLQKEFDSVIKSSGDITVKEYSQMLKKVYNPLVNSSIVPEQAMGAQIKAQADELLKGLPKDGTVPVSELLSVRRKFDKFIKSRVATPEQKGVYQNIADAYRQAIQDIAEKRGVKTAGGMTLKEQGAELNKLYSLRDAAMKNIEGAGGQSLVSLGNTPGAVIGSTVGPVGAAAGYAANAAANSAGGRRAILGGSKLAAGLSAGYASPDSITRQVAGIGKNLTLAKVLTGGGQSSNIDPSATIPNTSMNIPTTANITSNDYSNAEQMSTVEQSPYPKANLLADIQRDPKNASKYLEYYQQVKEIFNPEAETKPLNSTAAGTVTDLQNGIFNIRQLSEQIAASGANSPLIGALRSKNPFDTEAQSLQANISRVKQVIGKALEGGVLRKEDELKYAKILPTLNDTDAVAQYKVQVIADDLQRKLNLYQQNLGGGGGGNLLDSLVGAQQLQ
jgi:Arc/MetJ-type ribon-helix-helix transcriptional regulator